MKECFVIKKDGQYLGGMVGVGNPYQLQGNLELAATYENVDQAFQQAEAHGLGNDFAVVEYNAERAHKTDPNVMVVERIPLDAPSPRYVEGNECKTCGRVRPSEIEVW